VCLQARILILWSDKFLCFDMKCAGSRRSEFQLPEIPEQPNKIARHLDLFEPFSSNLRNTG